MAITPGHGSAVAIGEESTWGTPVATTHLVYCESFSASRDLAYVEEPHLGNGGFGSANIRGLVATRETSGGTLSFPLIYNDNGPVILLAHAFGAVADGGTTPNFTHTMTVSQANALKGLTIENRYGGTDQNKYEGCRINRTVITINAGEVAMCRCEYIAQTAAALSGSLTSLTHDTTGEFWHANHAGAMVWNGANNNPRTITITIDHKLERRYCVGGAGLTSEPQIGGKTEVTVEAELEHGVVTDQEAAYVAGTQGDLTITLTGTAPNIAAFTLQSAQITDVIERSVSAVGVITKRVKWRGISDGTDEGLELVLTNGTATYNA